MHPHIQKCSEYTLAFEKISLAPPHFFLFPISLVALNLTGDYNVPLFIRPSSSPSSALTHLTVQCSLLFYLSIE